MVRDDQQTIRLDATVNARVATSRAITRANLADEIIGQAVVHQTFAATLSLVTTLDAPSCNSVGPEPIQRDGKVDFAATTLTR